MAKKSSCPTPQPTVGGTVIRSTSPKQAPKTTELAPRGNDDYKHPLPLGGKPTPLGTKGPKPPQAK